MNKFFFLDLETTGLDAATCHILEVAAVITDHKLNILEEYTTPIWAPPSTLQAMDDWCKTTHKNSGLLVDVAETSVTLAEAELTLQKLKRKHFPVEKPAISGSSVHFDKRFIDQHMPTFSKELSHRIIDVSSFMGALSNYHNFIIESKREKPVHRAFPDIIDSIGYLKGYLERFK